MSRAVKVPIYAEYGLDLYHVATIEWDEDDDEAVFIEKLRPVLASLSA